MKMQILNKPVNYKLGQSAEIFIKRKRQRTEGLYCMYADNLSYIKQKKHVFIYTTLIDWLKKSSSSIIHHCQLLSSNPAVIFLAYSLALSFNVFMLRLPCPELTRDIACTISSSFFDAESESTILCQYASSLFLNPLSLATAVRMTSNECRCAAPPTKLLVAFDTSCSTWFGCEAESDDNNETRFVADR